MLYVFYNQVCFVHVRNLTHALPHAKCVGILYPRMLISFLCFGACTNPFWGRKSIYKAAQMGAMAQLNGDSGPFIRNTFFLYLSTILTIFCQFLIIYTIFVYQFGPLTSTIYHFRPFMTILGHLLAILGHFLPIFGYLWLYLAVCIGLYRRFIIFLTNSGPFRVRAQLEQARALVGL